MPVCLPSKLNVINFLDICRDLADFSMGMNVPPPIMSREEFEFVKGMCAEGRSIQDMIDQYAERYFVAGRAAEQAEDAFFANAVPTIKMYARELGYTPEESKE